eukprot:4511694-Pleurochrysis_carterae.AAC.3
MLKVSISRMPNVSQCLGANSSSTSFRLSREKKAKALTTLVCSEECGSRSSSQNLWCVRCCDAHQIGPPWLARHPRAPKNRFVAQWQWKAA